MGITTQRFIASKVSRDCEESFAGMQGVYHLITHSVNAVRKCEKRTCVIIRRGQSSNRTVSLSNSANMSSL